MRAEIDRQRDPVEQPGEFWLLSLSDKTAVRISPAPNPPQ
jgi:hypothetical protein